MTPLPKDTDCGHCGETFGIVIVVDEAQLLLNDPHVSALAPPHTPPGYCSPSCAHGAHVGGAGRPDAGGDDR